MKRTNVFFIAILLATAPFVSIAANANDQEIEGLLQNISVLVSEINGLLVSLNQNGAYAGIVAGVTANTPLPEIIIDNTSSQTKKSGTWCTSAALNFYGTNSIYSCGSGSDIFSWIPSFQESAKYEVFMWWTAHPNRSAQGLVQIAEQGGAVTQKLVNQQIDGGKWNSLGVYSFGPATGATAGSGGFVEISDQYGQVAADAVKFVKVDSSSSANTITSCGTLKRSGNYVVDRDLSASTEAGVYCLNIVDVNDIHIDCQNHNISGGTLINISSVNNFSLSSCTLTSLVKDYPSLYIEKSSNGTINNNTFNSWSVFTTNSSNLKFLKNNFNAFYSHIGSKFINIAENVFNPPQLKGGSGVIALARGSNNSVVNNSIDAKSNGLYGDQIGFDDGIIVEDETSDFVQGNTILNSWDCGIETIGFVSNSKFVGNTIKNHGFCGIGGWYWNSLKNNVFSNNSFDDVGSMFQFFRSYGLRSGPLLTGPDYPYDTYEYFQDNVFEGNKLLSLKQNPVPSFVNQFSPQIIAPLSSGTAGERMITEKDQIFSNNVFRNNDFGAQFEPPKFAPKNMVVDGGGNQCGPLTDSSYPLQCGKSVSSLPTLGADVYYLEDDGTILRSDGSIDIAALTNKFYKSYPDRYDFLTFYATFADNYAPNYHIVVKNDVEGIGMSVSLNTSLYGSAGKLRGVSILRNFAYSTVIHETAHQFLAYLPGFVYRAHWDQFIDLSFADGTYTYVNSPMGAAMGPWVDNGNGTFSEDPGKIPYRFSGGSGGPAERFNDSELYLMGLMSKSDVKPLSKLVPTGSQQIVDGKKTYPGYKVPVSVEQLIQAAGSERNPIYPSAPKDFTMAFIVLTKKGEALRGDYITNVNRIAENFGAEWSFATRGKSTVNGVSTPLPPSVPTTSLSASPLSITSGQSSILSWSSTNASSCSASGAWSGTKTISGTQVVTPTVTSTYTLTCTGSGGSATQSTIVTVSVSPPPPPPGDIIDNGAFGTSKTGSWCVSGVSGFYGTNSLYSCGLNIFETYRWSPSLPGTAYDTYEVSMWWTQHANRSTNVPVKILANIGGVQIPNTIYVNQQANGGKWNSLGTFLLGAGSYVEVSDKNGQANADAVKFVKKITAASGKLGVSLAGTPESQNIVRGTNNVHFATIVYNTSFSSEDVRIMSQGVTFAPGNGAQASDLNTCRVFDGATPLTSGANILSPGNAIPNQAVGLQFTFDTDLIVPRESIKKVDVKCNVSNSPLDNETFQIGLTSGASNLVSDTYAFGRTSGSSIAETVAFNSGPVMMVKTTGLLTVSRDASSPTTDRYGVAGSTDLTAIVLKFHAANEAIKLTKLRVVLGKGAKSTDIVKYTLWDGATKVGEGIFPGTDTFWLTTLYSDFIIPRDGDKLLTLKVDLANVGTFQPGIAGDIIYIGYGPADVSGTSGVGQSSGNLIAAGTPTDVLSPGIFLVRSFPTATRLAVPTNTLFNGEMTLNRFSVTANPAGDVGLYKVTFKVSASTSAVTSNFNLYGYSDSGFSTQAYSTNPVNWGAVSRQADGTVEIYFNPLRVGSNSNVEIPAGATRYFELRGTVAGAVSGDVVNVSLEGDEGFVLLDSAYNIDNPVSVLFPQDDFIWSGNTFTTSGPSTLDWTNGYAVPGLPSGGMSPQIFSK